MVDLFYYTMRVITRNNLVSNVTNLNGIKKMNSSTVRNDQVPFIKIAYSLQFKIKLMLKSLLLSLLNNQKTNSMMLSLY